jgi:SNF2 family DNA or RNA helicase
MENFEHIPMITQPRGLKIDLYPHQLASVHNMERMEREQKINRERNVHVKTVMGVNGDITGYGKTLAMVALVLRDKMPWDMSEQYTTVTRETYGCGRMERVWDHHYEKINTTLILVNQSIVSQWVEEFEHTDLKVCTVTTRRLVESTVAEDHDVIIITPTMFNRFIERYHNMYWKRFIFDEPGHVRVPAMMTVNAGFMWFVTATPRSIISYHRSCRTSFMYHLIDGANWYIFENKLEWVTIKNPDEFILQSYKMPPTHHTYYECYSTLFRALNGMVSDRIIAMIDANNIDGAIQALGGKKTDNITDLVKNRKLQELDEIESKIRIYTMRDDEKRLEKWRNQEVRVNNQIKELDRRFEDILSEDCNICYGKLCSPVMEPACQNIFCAKCLLRWMNENASCPMCRNEVKTAELVYITQESSEEKKEKIEEPPTKENTIINIIKKNPEGKFIVFSSFNETFNTIINLLKINDISYIEVKGAIKTMAKRIKQFKAGKIQVIFLNSKYNGSGLNLQEATDVIVYHKMSDDLLQQVLGRPNRIGRTEPLQVHHLIYK